MKTFERRIVKLCFYTLLTGKLKAIFPFFPFQPSFFYKATLKLHTEHSLNDSSHEIMERICIGHKTGFTGTFAGSCVRATSVPCYIDSNTMFLTRNIHKPQSRSYHLEKQEHDDSLKDAFQASPRGNTSQIQPGNDRSRRRLVRIRTQPTTTSVTSTQSRTIRHYA